MSISNVAFYIRHFSSKGVEERGTIIFSREKNDRVWFGVYLFDSIDLIVGCLDGTDVVGEYLMAVFKDEEENPEAEYIPFKSELKDKICPYKTVMQFSVNGILHGILFEEENHDTEMISQIKDNLFYYEYVETMDDLLKVLSKSGHKFVFHTKD